MTHTVISAYVASPASYPDIVTALADVPRLLGYDPGEPVGSARVVVRDANGVTVDPPTGESEFFDTAPYQIVLVQVSGTRRVPGEGSVLNAIEEEVELEDGTIETRVRLEYDESTFVDEKYDITHALSYIREGYKPNANLR